MTEQDDEVSRLDASLVRGGELLGFRVVQYAFGFVSGLVIARALGPIGRAEYALPLALATIALLVCHLSFEHAMSRMLSRGEASATELARLAAGAAAILGALGAGASLAAGAVLPGKWLGDASAAALVLASVTVLPSMYSLFSAAILFRIGSLRPWGLVQALGAAGQLALLAALEWRIGLTPEAVLSVNLALTMSSAVALSAFLHRELGPGALRPTADAVLWRKACRAGLILHPSSFAMYLNLRVDLFIVAALLGTRDAGLYSLAVVLAELVFVAASTLGVAALQHQAELSEPDSARYTADFARQSVALAAILAITAGLAAFPLIHFAYGSEWDAAAAPLAVLVFASVALAVEAPVRGLLLRVGRPGLISLAAVGGMITNVGLNFALVPAIGLVGAAIASLVSYSITALLMLAQMRNATGLPIRRIAGWPQPEDAIMRVGRRFGRAAGRRADR